MPHRFNLFFSKERREYNPFLDIVNWGDGSIYKVWDDEKTIGRYNIYPRIRFFNIGEDNYIVKKRKIIHLNTNETVGSYDLSGLPALLNGAHGRYLKSGDRKFYLYLLRLDKQSANAIPGNGQPYKMMLSDDVSAAVYSFRIERKGFNLKIGDGPEMNLYPFGPGFVEVDNDWLFLAFAGLYLLERRLGNLE